VGMTTAESGHMRSAREAPEPGPEPEPEPKRKAAARKTRRGRKD